MITQDQLIDLLSYDPETGVFRWRVSKARRNPDKIAGCLCKGYHVIKIYNKIYKSHRLAWLYMHANWPSDEIDHINMVKNDNRLCNLREATSSENKWNTRKPCTNTSGFKGVTWNKKRKKWWAKIRIFGKETYLGQFDNPSDAAATYILAAETHFHQFARAL